MTACRTSAPRVEQMPDAQAAQDPVLLRVRARRDRGVAQHERVLEALRDRMEQPDRPAGRAGLRNAEPEHVATHVHEPRADAFAAQRVGRPVHRPALADRAEIERGVGPLEAERAARAIERDGAMADALERARDRAIVRQRRLAIAVEAVQPHQRQDRRIVDAARARGGIPREAHDLEQRRIHAHLGGARGAVHPCELAVRAVDAHLRVHFGDGRERALDRARGARPVRIARDDAHPGAERGTRDFDVGRGFGAAAGDQRPERACARDDAEPREEPAARKSGTRFRQRLEQSHRRLAHDPPS
jgi:hypothetical protein